MVVAQAKVDSKLEVGQVVDVYLEPFFQEGFEGSGVLVKFHWSSWNGSMEYWTVCLPPGRQVKRYVRTFIPDALKDKE